MKRHKLDTNKLPELSKEQKKRIHSLTEEEINKAALSDPDALPLEDTDFEQLTVIPNPRRIRQKLGMSQSIFAQTYHLNLRTLQDWEQGRRMPDVSTRTFLSLILNFPEEIKKMVDVSLSSAK